MYSLDYDSRLDKRNKDICVFGDEQRVVGCYPTMIDLFSFFLLRLSFSFLFFVSLFRLLNIPHDLIFTTT